MQSNVKSHIRLSTFNNKPLNKSHDTRRVRRRRRVMKSNRTLSLVFFAALSLLGGAAPELSLKIPTESLTHRDILTKETASLNGGAPETIPAEVARLRGVRRDEGATESTRGAGLLPDMPEEPEVWDPDPDAAEGPNLGAGNTQDAAEVKDAPLADAKDSGLVSALSWLWEPVPEANEETPIVAQEEGSESDPSSSESDMGQTNTTSETVAPHEGHASLPDDARFYSAEELRSALGAAFDQELFDKVANADGLTTAQQLGETMLITGALTASQFEDLLSAPVKSGDSKAPAARDATELALAADKRSVVDDLMYVVKTLYWTPGDQVTKAHAPPLSASDMPLSENTSTWEAAAQPVLSDAAPAAPLSVNSTHAEAFRSLASPSTTTPCVTTTSYTFCGTSSKNVAYYYT